MSTHFETVGQIEGRGTTAPLQQQIAQLEQAATEQPVGGRAPEFIDVPVTNPLESGVIFVIAGITAIGALAFRMTTKSRPPAPQTFDIIE